MPLTLKQVKEIEQNPDFNRWLGLLYDSQKAPVNIGRDDAEKLINYCNQILGEPAKEISFDSNIVNFSQVADRFKKLAETFLDADILTRNLEVLVESRKTLRDIMQILDYEKISRFLEMIIKKMQRIKDTNYANESLEEIRKQLKGPERVEALYAAEDSTKALDQDYCMARCRRIRLEQEILDREASKNVKTLDEKLNTIITNIKSSKATQGGVVTGNLDEMETFIMKLEERIDNYQKKFGRNGELLTGLQGVYRKAFANWYRFKFRSDIKRIPEPYKVNDQPLGTQLNEVTKLFYKPAIDVADLMLKYQCYVGQLGTTYQQMDKDLMRFLDRCACAMCAIMNMKSLGQDRKKIEDLQEYLDKMPITPGKDDLNPDDLIEHYLEEKPMLTFATFKERQNVGNSSYAIDINPIEFVKQIPQLLLIYLQLRYPDPGLVYPAKASDQAKAKAAAAEEDPLIKIVKEKYATLMQLGKHLPEMNHYVEALKVNISVSRREPSEPKMQGRQKEDERPADTKPANKRPHSPAV